MPKFLTIKKKEYEAKISGDSIVLVDDNGKEKLLIRCNGLISVGGKVIPRIQHKYNNLEKLFPQFFPNEA
jgi:hypothetical protein